MDTSAYDGQENFGLVAPIMLEFFQCAERSCAGTDTMSCGYIAAP